MSGSVVNIAVGIDWTIPIRVEKSSWASQIIITFVALVSIMDNCRSGIEVGHRQTDVVVGKNIHDHNRAPYLSHVLDQEKKVEQSGSLG